MRNIPISQVPSQSFTVRVGQSQYELRLKDIGNVMCCDIWRDRVAIVRGVRVLAGEPLIPYRYLQSVNFLLLTLAGALPDWREFGKSQSLLLFEAEDLAEVSY